MSSQDMKNNAMVHGIIVRNYLNVLKIDASCTGETATISGRAELTREVAAMDEAVRKATTIRTLLRVEDEVKKIPGIDYVKWRLDNLTQVGRRWVWIPMAEAAQRRRKERIGEKGLPLVGKVKAPETPNTQR